MTNNIDYPRLSTILPLELIPEELDYLKNEISSFFDSLFYRNFNISSNNSGTFVSYDIEIVSANELKFEIPAAARRTKLS